MELFLLFINKLHWFWRENICIKPTSRSTPIPHIKILIKVQLFFYYSTLIRLLWLILIFWKAIDSAIKRLIKVRHPVHLILFVNLVDKFTVRAVYLYIGLGISDEVSKSLVIFKRATSLIFFFGIFIILFNQFIY